MEMIIGMLFAAPVAAFVIGAVLGPVWRHLSLATALLAPLLAYTFVMITTPQSEPGFWGWWLVGLMDLSLPCLLSAAISLLGFGLGRTLGEAAGVK